ncbi:MAG: hypothetical protein ACPG3Z_05690, partial [Saprospiraceae bacterium]
IKRKKGSIQIGKKPILINHLKTIINVIDDQKIEKIKKFALLHEPWDVSTGELTPTMKLKRRVIDKKYHDVIESIYA